WYISPWIDRGLDTFIERSTLEMMVCTRASAMGTFVGPSLNIECPNASRRSPLGLTQVTVPLPATELSPRTSTTETASPGFHTFLGGGSSDGLPPEPPRTGIIPNVSASMRVDSMPSPETDRGIASGA